jgi:hypothetical protein
VAGVTSGAWGQASNCSGSGIGIQDCGDATLRLVVLVTRARLDQASSRGSGFAVGLVDEAQDGA